MYTHTYTLAHTHRRLKKKKPDAPNLKECKVSTWEGLVGMKEKGENKIIAFYFQKYSLKVFFLRKLRYK